MKEGWEYKTIKECCEILDSRRKPITKSKREPGNIPYYGATGLLDYVKDYIFDETLVLLGEDGAKWGPGESSAYQISGKTWVNNHAHVLRPQSDIIDNYWLIYYLNFSDLNSFITGVTVPKLNQEKMTSISVPIPPLSEQQEIVEYLDSSFAKIDALKANAAKNLEEAKSLFQSALKEALEPKEGWEEKTLKDITNKIGSGATPKGGKKVYIEEGCSLIRSMNVLYNIFKYDELAHINDDAANQLKGVEIHKNDVLFNITGASIARCCVVPEDVLPARVNQHVSILRLNEGVLPTFLCYTLISPEHQKKLLKIGEAGSTRQALTKSDMENHTIGVPSMQEQQSIVSHLDSLNEKVNTLQQNYSRICNECDALKQAILRQVFE